MRRWLVAAALAVAAVVAVGELGDLTQSRPDEVRADAVTELVLAVDVDRFGPGPDAAADALWGVCAAQTSSHVEGGGGPEALGGGRYRLVLVPAVGHHERRKLVGCLEDLTIERVLGDVTGFTTVATRSPERSNR
jgi:hypothetical protein